MITFSFLDYLIIILYFGLVLYIGFRTKSSDKSNLDYLVAGRKLSLPIFIATVVSTFYGGILGVGEFTYISGLSSWLMYAFPFYIFIFLFAIFLSKKIRNSELYTIPDKLQLVYGKKVSILGAALVTLLVTPAPYILMMGIIIQMIFNIPFEISIIICIIVSVIYLYKGGLTADVRVNVVEFILMYLGFGIILPFCISNFGGLTYLTQNLPELHLTLTGGNSFQYIMVWFFIGAWALVDPAFHQRCYAAKNEKIAQRGILISLIFWFIFDFLTLTTGLYARASLENIDNPAFSYPLLAEKILPPFFKGFFFIGMIATVMSTLHSLAFISATSIGRDIICKIKGLTDNDNKYTKLGIIITSLTSLLIVILLPSVVQIWYTIGSLVIPALLISILSSYFTKLKINSSFIFASMLGSFLISLVFFLFRQFYLINESFIFFLNFEPMYPGLFIGLIIYFTGYLKKKFFLS